MTVGSMKRSQSMWTVTSPRFSMSSAKLPHRSNSTISASVWDVSDPLKTNEVIKRKYRKRSTKEKKVSQTRLSCGPCLCGDVDAVDSEGRSLLFYAARYGQMEVALQLLEAGCSPNQTDFLGNSPLHEAIERGHLDVAEIFLKDGKADVNLTGCNGDTPLMLAVSLGQIEACRLLHKYGADVNICDELGHSPIYRSLQRGWNEIADFLLDNQCDVNKTTANGMTCFFAAAHNNEIKSDHIARRLLKADYDFNKDTEWLATEGCPISLKDHPKTHKKILERSGLKPCARKNSFLSNGRRKLMKTLRSLSN